MHSNYSGYSEYIPVAHSIKVNYRITLKEKTHSLKEK
jgi:hypothetical protein